MPVLAVNAEELTEDEILEIMQKVLFEFPVVGIDVRIPKWMQSLPEGSKVVSAVLTKLKKLAPSLVKMKDCLMLENLFGEEDKFLNPDNIAMELGMERRKSASKPRKGFFTRCSARNAAKRSPTISA